MVGDAVRRPLKQHFRAVVRIVFAVAIGSICLFPTRRKSLVRFAIPLGMTIAILIIFRQFGRGPTGGNEQQQMPQQTLAHQAFHVNDGAQVLPVSEIPVHEFRPEAYKDIHEMVLNNISLHKHKPRKALYYGFKNESMGILYNASSIDTSCFWRRFALKWLTAETQPFDQSPTVAKYFLGGPFIGGKVFNTCVIVSNAGDMRNSSMGNFIDSHELVFRLNDAPTARYEADVGKTTSVRILNNSVWRNAYNPKKDKDKGFHSNPIYHNVVLAVWEACLKRGPFSSCLNQVGTPHVRKGKNETDDTIQPYFKRRQEFPEELFYFMNPDMLWDMWDMLQSFSPVPIVARIPSTGFLAVLVSLWHCKMVDLVGFTPTVRFRRGKGGNHYFDSVASGQWGSFNSYHPKTTEMSLLYKLNSLPDDDVFIKGVMRLLGFSSIDCTSSKFA